MLSLVLGHRDGRSCGFISSWWGKSLGSDSRITAFRKKPGSSYWHRGRVPESRHWRTVGSWEFGQQPFQGMSGSLGAERSPRRDIFTGLCNTQSDMWTEMCLMSWEVWGEVKFCPRVWCCAEGMIRTFWNILSLTGSHHFITLWGFGIPETWVWVLDAQMICMCDLGLDWGFEDLTCIRQLF